MKVKLAAQLFSEGVAGSIEYCNNKHKFPKLKNSEKTVKFLRIFNNLFDLRSIKSYGFKQAVCKENTSEVLQFAERAGEYILNLKIGQEQEMAYTSKRKTGFIGFQSLAHIVKNYILPENIYLKYFPFYKISQDYLEMFFTSI